MSLKSASLWFLVAYWSSVALAGDCDANRLHLTESPYENYFLSDCNTASHVIVTSPDDAHASATPRLLIAWPAGNSGIAAFFSPKDSNSRLGLHLENHTSGEFLESISEDGDPGGNPKKGVSGLIHFDSPATLTLPILGSIRSIRDYTEGGGNLNQDVQSAIVTNKIGERNDGGRYWRKWFDGSTVTSLDFYPQAGSPAVEIIEGDKWMLGFGQGTYEFRGTLTYPQLQQISPQQVLNPNAQDLIEKNPDQTTSLSFLSYSDKLLAGSWRFLTYFGRDSMISTLLLQSVLSEGKGGAIEAALAGVLERINKADGTVCHEEVIGDYATIQRGGKDATSSAPSCDYKMVDTDYFLPILMKNYFFATDVGRSRANEFLSTKATFLEDNAGMTYLDLAKLTIDKIMKTSAPFASNQVVENLISLNPNEPVGQWRDSNGGLGSGRTPYDVNTALVPASLRAITVLSELGLFSDHGDWASNANQYAKVWEDKTLDFFKVTISPSDAKNLVNDYVKASSFSGPSSDDQITGDVTFYGLALNGENGRKNVRVMNTDDCYRHFLLNTTDQGQLSDFISQTADHILTTFPVGLSTDVGLLVANPAYGDDENYAKDFKNSDYHGTVVWSWQLAMMAAGLGRQLDRCKSGDKPEFCANSDLYGKVHIAYEHLWDLINKNSGQLSGEVWSWKYDNGFKVVPLSAYSSTESDIRQLWSLAFLAIHKEDV